MFKTLKYQQNFAEKNVIEIKFNFSKKFIINFYAGNFKCEIKKKKKMA